MKNKLLTFVLKFVLFSGLFLLLMDTSGVVSITWKEWQITTSFNIFLMGFVGFLLLFGTLRWIKNKLWMLLNLSDLSRLKNFSKGLLFLEESLIQDYLGTEEQKQESLKKAEKFLPHSSLPKLLAYYQKTENLPKVSTLRDYGFLKTFSKIVQYRKEKNWKALEKFFQDAPKNLLKEGWFWRELFFYRKEINDWEGAKKALENSLCYRGLSKKSMAEEKAIVYYNLGLEESHPLKRLEYFQSSYKANPKNQENIAAYAQAMCYQKEINAAKKLLVKSWVTNPSWIIAETYGRIVEKDKTPLSFAQATRDLYEKNPDNRKSQECFAAILVQAKLFVEADSIIKKLEESSKKILLKILLETQEKKERHISFSDFKQFVHTLNIEDSDKIFLD